MEDNPYQTVPSLSFVCTKNRAGRDAAAEARAAGHHDLAQWFDRLAQRLDRAGMTGDEDYMQQARQIALENHCYYDEVDSEKEQRKEDV